ncbi:fibronectin type III domain-containing protein [Amycolatopsis pithecellobii]|nr:fibronectin type III domain-containing protein [Amycolatopsis pithecellobii]
MNTSRARYRRRLLIALTAGAVAGGTLLAPGVAQAATPSFVQGQAFTTGTRVASLQAKTGPVGASDLLVGWFAQYNTSGQVQVSDNVNGTWTRAPASTAFQNDTGDIALYYVANSKAAAAGLTVTVTAGAPAYFQGSVAEYSGVAVGGPLAQVVSNRGVGTAVDTGPTAAVNAGELVYSAIVTGGNPQSVTPGSSQGAQYTARAGTSNDSAYEQDIPASNAGSQHGAATLGASTDWYAVAAVFLPASTGDTQPPTTPAGLRATSVASTSVSLAWSPSTDNTGVTGYTVYRNGSAIGTTNGATTTYTDATVSAGTSYTYTVDAFDAAGNHSPPSSGLAVTTPASSPRFVQGAADSPGTRTTSTTLTLSAPVAAGDLLAGWFAEYDSPGQVQVSDNVNGAWVRSVSETFTNGGGDLALYYLPNTKAAPQGLTITLSAAAATYLPGAAGEYAGVAASAPLNQAVAASGSGTAADSGATPAVSAGKLVLGGLITGGQPLTVTPGSSQGVPFALQVHNGSESADLAGILAGAAGTQHAPFTLATGSDWYALCAVFQPG